MQTGKVISVNISEKKGTIKIPVKKIELCQTGVCNDAHSGMSLRQVSLLAKESIESFGKTANKHFAWGEFAENITTEGFQLHTMGLLDCFKINDTELEITQIGKTCHGKGCAIFAEVGVCIMPKEGIFARVIKGGAIRDADLIEYIPKTFNVAVITLSDRASKGEYPDKSGPRIIDMLNEYFTSKNRKSNISSFLIADDENKLNELITELMQNKPDIIITTPNNIIVTLVRTDRSLILALPISSAEPSFGPYLKSERGMETVSQPLVLYAPFFQGFQRAIATPGLSRP